MSPSAGGLLPADLARIKQMTVWPRRIKACAVARPMVPVAPSNRTRRTGNEGGWITALKFAAYRVHAQDPVA